MDELSLSACAACKVSLDLEMHSAVAAGALPALHADPFDRLLIASA